VADFSELVAQAVNPSMTRSEREAVYTVVRQAVQRLQEREALSPADARFALQNHLVEETIRDVEGEIARTAALRKLDDALAAQNKAYNERR
jgi:Arc/MetJ family transcription regulator